MAYPGLHERVARIRGLIAQHQRRKGWTHPVTIVAVTKTHGPEAVRAALAAGIPDVGENRVQEAIGKQEQCPDVPVRWHLIGTLQKNKARQVVGRFALIHSVDRDDLAAELSRRSVGGSRQPVLIQVNCSGEPQKGGVDWGDFRRLLEACVALPGIDVRGLMTMAALADDPETQRPVFRRLRELRDEAVTAGFELPELSMGMSGDYLVAVEEGATMVRLRTLLFGERGL
jgi:pyridoxal phosphate enzyme (YggS family)